MSEQYWLKTSVDDEVFPSYTLNKNDMNKFETSSSTPHEVYRNDTTAVEVIVKQVQNKNKTETRKHNMALQEINDRLCEDIENLKRELNKASRNLEDTKKCFRLLTFEMGKQLEAANQRELKRQTKYLVLQLENEKLKAILESKTNLLRKLRKEYLSVKRIIKVVLKGIRCIPPTETNGQSDLDLDYTDSEGDMKIKLPKTTYDSTSYDGHNATYETMLSSKV